MLTVLVADDPDGRPPGLVVGLDGDQLEPVEIGPRQQGTPVAPPHLDQTLRGGLRS
jgi:hypothetical protein